MRRKIVSLMLTLCMVLSLMPSVAFAEEVKNVPTDTESVSMDSETVSGDTERESDAAESVPGTTEKSTGTPDIETIMAETETKSGTDKSIELTRESQTDAAGNGERPAKSASNSKVQAQQNREKGIAVQAVTDYGVWINDFEFSSDNLTYKGTSGTAVYNPANKTLTLDNLAVTATMNDGAVIQCNNAGETIIVKGKNTITMPTSLNGKGIAAIALNGSTTVKGASGRSSDSLVIQSESSGGETIWDDGCTRRAGITYYNKGTLNIENVTITMNDTSGSNFLGHSTAIYDNADSKLTVQNAALNTTNTQHGIYMNYGSASLKDTVLNVQNTSVANSSGVNFGPDTGNVMENCSGTIGAEYAIYTYGALTISGGSQTKLILNSASDGIVVKKSSEASGAGSVTYSGMNMEIHAPGGIDIENSSKVTLNSGKITAYVSGKGVTVLDADAQFILNNGTLEVTGSGDSAVGIQSKGIVSIFGGAFHTSSVSAALQQAGTKEIVISGGTHAWTATVAGYGSHSSGGLKISESADVTVNAPSGIQLLKDTKGGLEITGGSVKLNCTSVGIYSESGAGKTTISGGKVIIKDTGNKSSATGIDAAGVLEIGGTADVSFENCNYDIKSANNDNKISGGKVTLSGSGRGLSVTGNFAVTGGEVKSSGDGYSLYGSDGTITLSGGSLNLSSSDYPIVAFKKCIIDFAGAEVTAESTKGNCALVIYDSESSYKVSDGEVILKSTQAGANKMYVSLAEGYVVFAGSGEKDAKIVGTPVLNTFTTNKYVRIAKAQKYTLTLVNVKEGTSVSVYGGAAIAYSAKDAESGEHFSHWELTAANKTTNVGTDERYTGTMPDSDAVLTAVYENCYNDKWQNDAENHWKECMVCHQKINSGVHNFGEWQTVKPATTTEKGEQKRSCTVCGYAEYQEIPKLPSGKYTLTLVNVKEGTNAEFSAGAELSYTAQDAESGQHFLHWELTVNNQTDEVGTNPKYTGSMSASNATLTAVYEDCSGGEWQNDADLLM